MIEYAAMITQGVWLAKSNHRLAAANKQIFKAVSSKRTVFFSHVKGHADHKWNDRADELANRGRTSSSTRRKNR